MLRPHLVPVTKYRRPVLTSRMLNDLEKVFANIFNDWQCRLMEFGAEADHVHLLIEIHPALNISTLINNMKPASSRRVRNLFASRIANYYWKPFFWNRAYYVGSVGSVTLETIRRYVEQQNTKSRAAPAA